MEYNDNDKTRRPFAVSYIPFSSSSRFTHPISVFQGPCAACRFLRRRCNESCILAPYFPPDEPFKFINAHKVFGASNIVKTLQYVAYIQEKNMYGENGVVWYDTSIRGIPQSNRADAVSCLIYEANARIRDPVYGCADTISQLLKQLDDLKAELAMAQAELSVMQCQ